MRSILIRVCTTLLAQLLFSSNIYSQHIRGLVTDTGKRPIQYANVILYSQKDTTFISGSVTDINGEFTIDLEPNVTNECFTRTSAIGYESQDSPIQSGITNISVTLREDTLYLESVKVVAQKPRIKAVSGGIEVAVENTLLSGIGTADDLLSRMPKIRGKNGTYTVFSKGVPEIYINKRKVEDAIDLKHLKSNNIKSVEIITAPDSRYDAETEAVIRINTIKSEGDGFSTNLFTQTWSNNKCQNYDDLDFHFRKNKLDVFGIFSFENTHSGEKNTVGEQLSIKEDVIHIIQDAPSSGWDTDITSKVGGCYDIGNQHSIGGFYQITHSLYSNAKSSGYQEIKRNHMAEVMVTNDMLHRGHNNPTHEFNVYYIGTFGKLKTDFNATHINRSNKRDDMVTETCNELKDREVNSNYRQRNKMTAGKLVLEYPLWKGIFRIGGEWSVTHSHGLYRNQEEILPSSDNNTKEHHLTGFALYDITIGSWNLGAGFRHENIGTHYTSTGEKEELRTHRKFHEFFPQLHAGYKGEDWAVQVSYSHRTTRPSYHQLNNFVQYDNRYAYEGGNPQLVPSEKKSLTIEGTWSWINTEIGYDRTNSAILPFASFFNGHEAILWKPTNFKKIENIHASIVVSPRWGFYIPTWELDFSKQHFPRAKDMAGQSMSKPYWNLSLENWFSMPNDWYLLISCEWTTCHDIGFRTTKKSHHTDIRAQKSFLQNRLTMTLFANDLFKSQKTKWVATYPMVKMSKNAYSYTRCVGFSISLNLNKTDATYKGTGAGNEERHRL